MEFLSEVVQYVLDLHRQFHMELSRGLRDASEGRATLLPLAGGAFGLGMVHALTPGHGKAILFTYFLGRRARPWAGLAAAAQLAGMHIGAAGLLVLGFGGAASLMGRAAGAAALLQVISAAAVCGAGAWYLRRALRSATPPEPEHSHAKMALAAGLLPCPLTMMILSIALSRASLGTGVALVAAMGLGIMATVGIIGTTGIVLQRGIAAEFGDRLMRPRATLSTLETASALIILGLGIYSLVVTIAAWS